MKSLNKVISTFSPVESEDELSIKLPEASNIYTLKLEDTNKVSGFIKLDTSIVKLVDTKFEDTKMLINWLILSNEQNCITEFILHITDEPINFISEGTVTFIIEFFDTAPTLITPKE